MAIQTLHDTGIDIPSKYDGGVYAVATNDCVIQGIGDEFTINYTSDSRNVTFNAGSQAIIGGAFFHVTSSTTIELTANTTIYLCAEIDLSRADGNRGIFKQRTSSDMAFENLNGSGVVRDLLLYIVTTNANGVTSVQDRRVMKSGASLSWTDVNNKPFSSVDNSLSSSSTNPVQNKVVNSAITTHTHGNITNDGKMTATMNVTNGQYFVMAGSDNILKKALKYWYGTSSQLPSSRDANTIYFVKE